MCWRLLKHPLRILARSADRNGEAITEVKRDGEGVKYALIDEATGEIQTTGENQISSVVTA